MPDVPEYFSKFTYYKDYSDDIRNLTNSLCFEENASDPLSDPFKTCHPMHPCSDDGLILPLFFEETWPKSFRVIIYLVGLLYSFLGVSIVADRFKVTIYNKASIAFPHIPIIERFILVEYIFINQIIRNLLLSF